MPEKDPSNWSGIVWLIAIGSAVAGGIMAAYIKWIGDETTKLQLAIEWLIGALLGFFIFMLTVGIGIDEGVCGFSAAMAGSMSASLLKAIHAKIKSKIEGL